MTVKIYVTNPAIDVDHLFGKGTVFDNHNSADDWLDGVDWGLVGTQGAISFDVNATIFDLEGRGSPFDVMSHVNNVKYAGLGAGLVLGGFDLYQGFQSGGYELVSN